MRREAISIRIVGPRCAVPWITPLRNLNLIVIAIAVVILIDQIVDSITVGIPCPRRILRVLIDGILNAVIVVVGIRVVPYAVMVVIDPFTRIKREGFKGTPPCPIWRVLSTR